MARPLRIEYPGAVYHVTARGNGRQEIFHDDHDYRKFLEVLGKTIGRFNWLCHAYCLMGNHYHLMIETPDANISKGMRHLNGVFSQAHHKRHETVGHLFQGRFKAIIVDRESYLLELARYVVLNPVRAGLVARPEDWPWSSYRIMAGLPLPWGSITAPSSAASPGWGETVPASAAPGYADAETESESESGSEGEGEAAAATTAAMNAGTAFAVKDETAVTTAAAAGTAAATKTATAATATAATEIVKTVVTSTGTDTAVARSLPEGSNATGAGAGTETDVSPTLSASPPLPFFPETDFLLGQFGSDLAAARLRYREFVAAGISREGPWRHLRSQLFLGNETFIEKLNASIASLSIPVKGNENGSLREIQDIREIPKRQRFAGRPTLQEIFGSDIFGARRGKGDRRKRDEAILAGSVIHGYDQKEIADFLGLHYTTVSRAIKRQEGREKDSAPRRRGTSQ